MANNGVGSIGSTTGGFNTMLKSGPDFSNKTESQLKDILSDKNASGEDKMAALLELLKRTPPSSSNSDEDDLMKLLMKLLSGQISPEELKKLAQMLGVDPSALEGLKGSGSGTGNSSLQPGDIK